MLTESRRALVVTGGSRGIGAAVARLAGSRGYSVAVNFLSKEEAAYDVVEEIRSSGERVMAIASGVARPEIDAWVREIAAFEVGRPPLLVVARGCDEETMRWLRVSLIQSGFIDVSLRTLT